MKRTAKIGVSVATGFALALAVAAPAAAWHPKGEIKKYVQNVTTNSELSDADNAEQAVAAKKGDTLKYVIEVKNTGEASSNGYNDMHETVMRDVLPVGVELASDNTVREIVEEIGVIKPGETVRKEYTVKVVADTDGAIVANRACFMGDSEVKDQPQAGCDEAVIKVSKTADEPQEEPEEEPEEGQGGADEPEVEAETTTLPETGFGAAGLFTTVSGLGYAASRVVNRKRR